MSTTTVGNGHPDHGAAPPAPDPGADDSGAAGPG